MAVIYGRKVGWYGGASAISTQSFSTRNVITNQDVVIPNDGEYVINVTGNNDGQQTSYQTYCPKNTIISVSEDAVKWQAEVNGNVVYAEHGTNSENTGSSGGVSINAVEDE